MKTIDPGVFVTLNLVQKAPILKIRNQARTTLGFLALTIFIRAVRYCRHTQHISVGVVEKEIMDTKHRHCVTVRFRQGDMRHATNDCVGEIFIATRRRGGLLKYQVGGMDCLVVTPTWAMLRSRLRWNLGAEQSPYVRPCVYHILAASGVRPVHHTSQSPQTSVHRTTTKDCTNQRFSWRQKTSPGCVPRQLPSLQLS